MFPRIPSGCRRAALGSTVSLAVAVAVAVTAAAAPPPGERWSDMAFPSSSNWRSYPRPAATAPPVYPARSTVQVRVLPYSHAAPAGAAEAPRASVIAHLPPGADLWVGDRKLVSEASQPTFEFVSTPLEAGKESFYRVKVMWLEGDRWVTQAHAFPVHPGDTHCIEVVPVDAAAADRDVAASLAKLSKEDRAAAEAQKFCAVQDTIRLGSMGPPVKADVGGKAVYLCCEGCRPAAEKDPAKALKTAEANKTKAQKPGSEK